MVTTLPRATSAAIKEAVAYKGVSVVIAKQTCTLLDKNLKRQVGKPFFVSDRCKKHRNCVNDLGCPAFYIEGDKARINATLCSGCGACVDVCAYKAIELDGALRVAVVNEATCKGCGTCAATCRASMGNGPRLANAAT